MTPHSPTIDLRNLSGSIDVLIFHSPKIFFSLWNLEELIGYKKLSIAKESFICSIMIDRNFFNHPPNYRKSRSKQALEYLFPFYFPTNLIHELFKWLAEICLHRPSRKTCLLISVASTNELRKYSLGMVRNMTWKVQTNMTNKTANRAQLRPTIKSNAKTFFC